MSVPKLRFKEFDGDWLSAPLKKYFPKIRNGFVGVATPYYVEKGVKYLQGKNVKDGKIDPAGLIYISEEFHLKKNNSKLSIDDILMVQSGHVGECAVIEREYDNANCHALIVLSPHQQQKTNSHFVKYYFYTPLGKKIISQVKTGNTIEHVLASEIKEVELNFPSKEEQTKIASFLSNVDEKISQLTQKHELLSQYKQGMMQKLFSQQVRFKADDGSEFGEWEETTISKISSTISTGATPSTLKEEYWNGNIKWMSSGELNHRHVHDVEKTITELGFKSSSTKILPKHCVLIGLAGQGKTRGTVAINYIELCTNQSIAAIHPNPKVFDYRFIFFNLDMRYQELRALSTGDGGRGGLNLQIIKGVEIHLPCLEEQTKIANFLSSIDQKIEVVAQQIEQAKTWKKGLLQQMFV